MAEESAPVKPFACTYTPQVPELIQKLNCSLAVSTYQAGKLIFLSPKDEERIVQLPRTFEKAMGISLDPESGKLALATKDEIIVFRDSPELAAHYPNKPGTYDALFMPRAKYLTGPVDIHDLDRVGDELYAINTMFSCLIRVDEDHSFTPVWKPPFVSRIASEDRCHLNGMALKDGQVKYVTSFNQGDEAGSWRESMKSSTRTGTVIDVSTDEVLVDDLPMPHSPRVIDGDLYVLLSATGELAKVNTENGSWEVVARPGGFVRGMAYHKEHLFIANSKLRKNSSAFAHLDIADEADHAGIKVYHLPTASYVGEIRYQASVDEIYDVQVLPGKTRPNILNTQDETYKMGLTTPDSSYWGRRREES